MSFLCNDYDKEQGKESIDKNKRVVKITTRILSHVSEEP